jgi:hypothetical protein
MSLLQNSFVLPWKLTFNPMKEFLLLIRTEGDVWASLSPQQLQEHIEKGTSYIARLMKEGTLKSAAPLEQGCSREVTAVNGSMRDYPFNESKEAVAGYFHIIAKDIREAVAIAKANPIFKDIPAKIEVHLMKSIGG